MLRVGSMRLGVAVAVAGLLAAACGATGGPGAGETRAGSRAAPAASSATPSPPSAPAPGPARSPLASIGPGEGEVSVLAPGGYAEWGGTDPKVNWISGFEKSTGCKVTLRSYDPERSEEPGGFDPGSFDVIAAPPQVSGRLIAEGKVAPLNTGLIDGYGEIPKRLRTLPAVRQGDRVYGVPFLWGITEVLYDPVRANPAGRSALFSGAAPALIKDSPMSIAEAALALRERGEKIDDPYDLTPEQLERAVSLFRSGAQALWRDPIEVVEGFASGTARLALGTPYHRDVLRRGGRPIAAVPARPVTGWADAWLVSAAAAHPSCAYQWLSWTLSAEVQRKAAAWNGLAPVNPEGCTGRTQRICEIYRVGEPGAFDGVLFAVRPPGYAQWAERWAELPR
nr:ABC transporter substrate-binding protein [Actinomycetales bacterium]